ncbi:hypothetical protein HanXRQr2_Chr16g0751371 [Helianthus annuus]|uniref:Uncharacterized protein n=1 Tax=Helianthus annuus TaxID=4232 RepID=A0A251RZA3_HELAN|nr:hypothetical protein HanXRQr2_Chr16g0751371 [Helianthus annuus]KAJ0821426.1 hypothetical protein HanPSC8_Chr16g0720051 [Helianthus annuus]
MVMPLPVPGNGGNEGGPGTDERRRAAVVWRLLEKTSVTKREKTMWVVEAILEDCLEFGIGMKMLK